MNFAFKYLDFFISEVKEGKLGQALKEALRNILEFGDIKGLRSQIRTYLTAPEGISLLDFGMPDL